MFEISYIVDGVVSRKSVNCEKINIIDGMIYCGDDFIIAKEYFICANRIKATIDARGIKISPATLVNQWGISGEELAQEMSNGLQRKEE